MNILKKTRNRLINTREQHRLRNLSKPSFRTKLAERKRIAERVRKLRGVGDVPIYSLETKVGHKAIAEKAGIRTSRILQGPVDTLSDFDLEALPEKFVIKPIVGSGANGIFFLQKKDTNLLNIFTGEIYPLNLTALYSTALDRFKETPFIAEELLELEGRPSINWKAFSFYGEVALLRQIDEVGFYGKRATVGPDKRYKMWSPEGRELGKIEGHDARYDSTLPPATNIGAIVDAANKISKSMMTPFVRVDLYETDRGVYFGEATLRPGSLWKKKASSLFIPEWDKKLGIMWEEAEARLIDDIDETYLP